MYSRRWSPPQAGPTPTGPPKDVGPNLGNQQKASCPTLHLRQSFSHLGKTVVRECLLSVCVTTPAYANQRFSAISLSYNSLLFYPFHPHSSISFYTIFSCNFHISPAAHQSFEKLQRFEPLVKIPSIYSMTRQSRPICLNKS